MDAQGAVEKIFVVQERLNGILGFVLYGMAVYIDTKPSVHEASTRLCCEVTTHSVFTLPERRSTIEVHPPFSEAPHLRSPIPLPKTDFSKKQKCIAANHPMARVFTTFLFEIKIGIQTIWAQVTPFFRNKITEMCYLYRRTGPEPLLSASYCMSYDRL